MSSKKKVFYLISHLHKSIGFEWTAIGLKEKFHLFFVLLNPTGSVLETFLKTNNIGVARINYRNMGDLPKAFLRLCWLFVKERPAIVHTHLFDATLIGMTAAWITGVRKRIYTRHNSTFHHMYFPKAVKYDHWINRISTQIVSISQATDQVLLETENVPARKLRRIPHGFNLKAFTFVDAVRVRAIKEKWRVFEKGPCVGVIARHIEWKGIQFIIPAFREFLKAYPEACLILANASGPYHDVILGLLKDIPAKNVILIPFEEDVAALYKVFDIYVHTPIDSTCEAFGQTYVEALASGVPAIFTLSGIAAEFVKHKENALVVNFKNASQIYIALIQLWTDQPLRSKLIEQGKHSVDPLFTLSLMLKRLEELYDEQ